MAHIDVGQLLVWWAVTNLCDTHTMTGLHVLVLPHVPSLIGDATLLTRLTSGSLSQQAGVQL
jgi:hypothetical protein